MNLLENTSAITQQPETSGARNWVRTVIEDPEQPVVIFGTAWCGYCRAALNLLDVAGTPYRYIDTEDRSALGGVPPMQVRTALREMTGSRTVPQVFIGGESIGGASELFSAWRSGQLAPLLEQFNLPFKEPH